MIESADAILDEVARALYKQSVIQAREEIDALSFTASELKDLFIRLRTETETARILIFASYLEDRVTALIKLRLYHLDTPKIEKEIFGGHGPLGTFGSRLALAYQLGWISPKQKARLDAFKNIRNEFAHRAFSASFSDQNISDWFLNMNYNVFHYAERMRRAVGDQPGSESEGIFISGSDIDGDLEKLLKLLLLVTDTMFDLLVLPSAIVHRVEAGLIVEGFGKESQLVMDIRRDVARATLALLKKERDK
ncbi:hypothetical protein [Methylocystis hirsuta]|nr:hypothetical protein [Methylocystis hirsuta]